MKYRFWHRNVKIKINRLNLHASFAHKFAHTNILQKTIAAKEKRKLPFANKTKSIPPKRTK